jgi:hypothetical protein
VAVPAALSQNDRAGLFGFLQLRLRSRRDTEWRCPNCFGPVHQGDEPLKKRSVFSRAIESIGMAIFITSLLRQNWALAIAGGASAALLILLVQIADRHVSLEPAPALPAHEWLDDARASYARGTHISTLAVRYDVEPEWLEGELRKPAGA